MCVFTFCLYSCDNSTSDDNLSSEEIDIVTEGEKSELKETANPAVEENAVMSRSETGKFEENVNWNLDMEDMTGACVDFSVTKELALKISDCVLEHIYGDKAISNTVFKVCEIAGNNYYVVTRYPEELRPGYDYNVALDKTDGRILKIWMGE